MTRSMSRDERLMRERRTDKNDKNIPVMDCVSDCVDLYCEDGAVICVTCPNRWDYYCLTKCKKGVIMELTTYDYRCPTCQGKKILVYVDDKGNEHRQSCPGCGGSGKVNDPHRDGLD